MTKEYQREYDRRYHEDAKLAYNAFISCYPLTLDDLPDEQWKPVVGFEGYAVSSYGRVKSFKQYRTGKIRKPVLIGKYLCVSLSFCGEEKFRTIHSLVAETFIPNPDNKPEVNHRVGCKFNCHVSNLEWATSSENRQHAVKNGLQPLGVDRSDSKIKNEKDIIYIRDNPDKLTLKQLAEKFGVDLTTISQIQLGKKYKSVGGTVRKPKFHMKRIPDEIRAQIRADYATGSYSLRALARKYGCDLKTVRRIVNEG